MTIEKVEKGISFILGIPMLALAVAGAFAGGSELNKFVKDKNQTTQQIAPPTQHPG